MKEIYIQSEKRNVTVGSFIELNKESGSVQKGSDVDVVFTDPANGENLIMQCRVDSVGRDKIGLNVKPEGYTEVSASLEIFLMGVPENFPINS